MHNINVGVKLYFLRPFYCLFFSIVPPKIKLLSSERDTQEGDSINLTCIIIDGSPEPQISWFKDGDLQLKEKTTLILANVTDRDEGTYTCQGQNFGGSFTDSINLTVNSKFRIIIMNIPTIKR